MKILSTEQIRLADLYTIEHEPIASIDLMERAASVCCEWLEKKFRPEINFVVFCGPGNNGGDGLAIARMLMQSGYTVKVFCLQISEKRSDDFALNHKRLLQIDKNSVTPITNKSEFPFIAGNSVVLDALFGSGLNRTVSGLAAELIDHINSSEAGVVSIDIPSGLFADKTTPEQASKVKADITLTFQFPKLCFMFPGSGKFAGEWVVMDIKLHSQFIRQQTSPWNYFTLREASRLIPAREKFSHKGNFGHSLLITGSRGKMGAAVLAVKACLRSGTGMLTVHIPACGETIIQSTCPEAMVSLDSNTDIITALPDFSPYSTIGIGPGIGTNPETWETLRHLLYSFRKPVVLDADALNLLSQHKDWLEYIPENSILTPHLKEFSRLTKETNDDFERMQLQINFAKQYKVIVVLKGAHTCIAGPDGNVWFNSTGNPGMARGGSGDVLTGILVGLLAQGIAPMDAARLGVFLHGKSGDEAAKRRTELSMLPSDIIRYFPLAIQGCMSVS
ncbi:MAG: NAD(P)H-hydrate dehydratase [Bacteroidia bacterium]